MGRFTLSLSGPDNVGKTTLLSLFPRAWPVEHVGGVQLYLPEMAAMVKDGSFSDWSFGIESVEQVPGGSRVSDVDFVRAIAAACNARHVHATRPLSTKSAGSLAGEPFDFPGAALDCSSTMFEAVCIARIGALNNLTIDYAEKRYIEVLSETGVTFPTEDVRIFVRLRGSLDETVAWTLAQEERSKPIDDVYHRYQHLLHQALYRQVDAGRYTAVVYREPHETFLTSLTRITKVLHDVSGAPKTWCPLLEHVRCCVAFGGLSECGKSTVATETVKRGFAATEGGAFRLKIGYLLDKAGERLGQRVYDLPEDRQALELVHELDHFSRSHRWIEMITLESLHCFPSTRRLRELIGQAVPFKANTVRPAPGSVPPKFVVVYLDTPLALRKSRTEAEGKLFDPSKDDTKRGRGADKIIDIADIVVRNDGAFAETCDQVMSSIKEILPAWGA